MTEWVVVVGRWLIVANRALLGGQLREELHQMIGAGSSSLLMLARHTSAAAYRVVPAASDVQLRGLAWWATSDRGPATGGEASMRARQRLSQVLADVADGGLAHADG